MADELKKCEACSWLRESPFQRVLDKSELWFYESYGMCLVCFEYLNIHINDEKVEERLRKYHEKKEQTLKPNEEQ